MGHGFGKETDNGFAREKEKKMSACLFYSLSPPYTAISVAIPTVVSELVIL